MGGYYYYYYYIVKYVKGIPTDTIGYCDFVNSEDYNKYIKEYGEEAYNMFTNYLDLSDSYKEQIQYTHRGNWILHP
ncbi:MAG TPA: hypothetical protein PKA75_11345 [Chitinophagales bacterium]|nr:hypothetical protein [Chitinophagales bacterium]